MSLIRVLRALAMVCLSNRPVDGTRSQPTNLSEHSGIDDAIVHLIDSLRWSSVTVFLHRTTDLHDTMVDQLYQRNISTIVLLEDTANEAANASSCSSLVWTAGFVVLGTFSFAQDVFKQVLEYTEACCFGNMLFTSEWLTAVTEDELHTSLQLFHGFQHVAVVVFAKTGSLSLWTLRHTQGVSDITRVTSLPPALPLNRHRVLPNLSHGLGGRTLRVVTRESTFMVMKTDSDQGGHYQGLAIDILHELSLHLNFSYVFVPSQDSNWGMEMDNGQWNGAIGMLARKEVDLAASSFAINFDRNSVADATTPFMYETATIIFRANQSTQGNLTFFTKPFQPLVFGAIGGCFLMVLVLLLLLEKWRENLHLIPPEKWKRAFQHFMADCEILVTGLLSKPTEREKESRGGRVLVVTWLLLGMVLASVYSSQLTSSMTVRQQTLPFTSLSQLLDQDTYTWGFLGGGSSETLLKFSTVPDLQRFYQGAMEFTKSDPDVQSGDEDVQMAKVVQGNYGFFASSSIRYNVLAANYCDIKRLPDVQMTSSYGFYLQKCSPYTNLISDGIGKMEDSGLIDFWRRKWSPRPRQCEPAEDEKSGKVIGLTETQTAFYLAALGLATAGLALLLETLWKRHVQCKTKQF